MKQTIAVNSWRAWVQGARPYSLPGAAAPVLLGSAWAWHVADGQLTLKSLIPFVLCLLFALVMQVAANLINDYVDFRRGTDRPERVGPSRMFAQGLITEPAMRRGIAVCVGLGCLLGLPLILYGGWPLIAVGALCVAACFLYSTHLSYHALGDVLVVLFFGIVPVYFTYHCLCSASSPFSPPNWGESEGGMEGGFLLGLAMGLATDCLLLVNNYRDRAQDPQTGKRTLIVLLGGRWGLRLYLLCGILAAAIALCVSLRTAPAMVIYLILHLHTFSRMRQLEGQALNPLLGQTARNMLLFALLSALCLVLPIRL